MRADLRDDLIFWRNFLHSKPPPTPALTLPQRRAMRRITTDASLDGIAGACFDADGTLRVWRHIFSRKERALVSQDGGDKYHISELELLALAVSVRVFAPPDRCHCDLVTDNQACVAWLSTGREKRDYKAGRMLQWFSQRALARGWTLSATWVASEENVVCDTASRPSIQTGAAFSNWFISYAQAPMRLVELNFNPMAFLASITSGTALPS